MTEKIPDLSQTQPTIPEGYEGIEVTTVFMGMAVSGLELTHKACKTVVGIVPKIVGVDLFARELASSHNCGDPKR